MNIALGFVVGYAIMATLLMLFWRRESRRDAKDYLDVWHRHQVTVRALERERKNRIALDQLNADLWKRLTKPHCHANNDGDCNDFLCPQIRDDEPMKTGRNCPLDTRSDEE